MTDRRVLRLVTRLNVGGPARHALLLSRGLAPAYQTTLAVGTPEASEGELVDPAVPLTRIELVRPVRPAADVRAFRSIRRLLHEQRPAIVHTHMAKAGTLGRLAVRTVRDRPRTVHTFHGHVLDGYFGPAVERAFTATERQLARVTDVFVAVSPEVRDELLALGIGRPEQIEIIPLGLELAPFAAAVPSGRLRSELGVSDGAPLVGLVGRLVPIKDHTTALRTIARIPGAHLAIIGDGECRAELERATAALDLADRVHFTGWRMDMPAAVADLDVVLLTSRNEGTPVALIEASAAGRPVVSTDVGGVRSVVEHGVTGLLAPAEDDDQLAAHLRTILGDAALARRMGQAGPAHVLERFGERRLLDDIARLYDSLLA